MIRASYGDKPPIELPFNWEKEESVEVEDDRNPNLIENEMFEEETSIRMADIRLVDRSFTDLGYVGYSDGIEIEKLDSCANWQFS